MQSSKIFPSSFICAGVVSFVHEVGIPLELHVEAILYLVTIQRLVATDCLDDFLFKRDCGKVEYIRFASQEHIFSGSTNSK